VTEKWGGKVRGFNAGGTAIQSKAESGATRDPKRDLRKGGTGKVKGENDMDWVVFEGGGSKRKPKLQNQDVRTGDRTVN